MESSPLLMVAEDDPDDQYMIQYVVNEACPPDIETYYAWDGMELLSALEERIKIDFLPDLIVLDLNMPRKDGRQALKEIKTDSRLASIPVAILTTSGSDEDIRFCNGLGVVGYYRKPSSISELRDIMSKLCDDYLSMRNKSTG